MSDEGYKDMDGNPISLERLCVKEPGWAANRIRHMRQQLTEHSARESAQGEGWKLLQGPDGTLAVDEGETYWFAIQVSTNGAKPHWEYFRDAVVWDAETAPEWSSGEHGWDINDEMWFRALPPPPKAEGK
jgi:hypothetical protein